MKKKTYLTVLAVMVAFILFGCDGNLDSKEPVTLTIWHTYVEQMQTAFGELVDEFNSTVGMQKGIVIKTTHVGNATPLNELLINASNNDPGAPGFPDLAIVYPRIAVELAEKGVLMDISSQFSEDELSRFVPEFLEEGKLDGNILYILPVAKSTEVMYVNITIFDRFAAGTGVTLAQLATFEGILDAAEKYYAWTDAKTPDIQNDGKAFYYPDSLFNHAMIGFKQLGEDFISDQALNLDSPVYQRIWDSYFPFTVKGGIALFNDYGNYLAKTGDIVCTTSTSAGVIYYPDSVTYPDNTKEDVEYAILPYPVFEGGEKVALQRGGGMCVLKSDSKKEYAAGVFLKWLTEPEQNLRFTANTGYMPVTTEAFGIYMEREIKNMESEKLRKMYETIITMQKEYTFYVPPVFSGFEEMQKRYNEDLYEAAGKARYEYLGRLGSLDPDAAFDEVSQGAFERFVAEH